MSKFAREARPARPVGPLSSTGSPIATHEGGEGWAMDARTELFTLGVANFVGEQTFYESGRDRDSRFVALVHQLAGGEHADRVWLRAFISWLRDSANMRSASIVAACEYVRGGGDHGRSVVSSTCVRADEPAEVVAYWISRYGRTMPAAIKRGVADAVAWLYTERSAIKYDSAGAAVRMGDVIDLTHPKPTDARQASLFKYLLDVRHKRDDPRLDPILLVHTLAYRQWISNGAPLDMIPQVATWENLSAHHKMDAAAWEAIIPRMGYMALLRNLRNFEDAKVSPDVLQRVADRLADEEEVARSRQLPFRFLSAWEHSGSTLFAPALERALDLSVSNIPEFAGRTLVLVDTSGSMEAPLSGKSKVTRVSASALFGAAVAARSKDADLWIYATDAAPAPQKRSVLRTAEAIRLATGQVGHGTNTWPAFAHAYKRGGPYDRTLIFTDSQDHPHRVPIDEVPSPIYVWDLGGYGRSNIETGSNRYLLAGLNDQAFKLVRLLEDFRPGVWPWDAQ